MLHHWKRILMLISDFDFLLFFFILGPGGGATR